MAVGIGPAVTEDYRMTTYRIRRNDRIDTTTDRTVAELASHAGARVTAVMDA